MATQAKAAAAAPSSAPIASFSLLVRPAAAFTIRATRCFPCQVALSADLSSSPEIEEEEQLGADKIGKKVRVTVHLKVYHVQKAALELDLNGLEALIEQYVGVWKGKRISSNLPFKVEFQIVVEGQHRPVKFVSHLKEEEFEYLE